MAADTVMHTPQMRSLRLAVAETVDANGGQIACAALGTRIKRHQTFSDIGSVDRPEWATIDVAFQIEQTARREGNWPAITRWFAQHHGFALVKLPEGDPGCGDVYRALADKVREHGEMVGQLMTDLADHVLTQAEARAALPRVLASAEAAMRLHVILEQIAEGA